MQSLPSSVNPAHSPSQFGGVAPQTSLMRRQTDSHWIRMPSEPPELLLPAFEPSLLLLLQAAAAAVMPNAIRTSRMTFSSRGFWPEASMRRSAYLVLAGGARFRCHFGARRMRPSRDVQ